MVVGEIMEPGRYVRSLVDWVVKPGPEPATNQLPHTEASPAKDQPLSPSHA